MKKLILLLFILGCNVCIAHTNQDSTALKAQNLKKLYLLSTTSTGKRSIAYKKKFFREFPNSFKELDRLYGYNENKPTPLYDEAYQHIINLFNTLDCINDTLYYKKIIAISIRGHWDADAINYFQDGLQQKVFDNLKLTVFFLKSMPEKDIKSFWFFFFDGPHPNKQLPKKLTKIKVLNLKIYDLMVAAHKDVLAQPLE